jgi:ribosomal protein S18 acetylase RimI-like enzyme
MTEPFQPVRLTQVQLKPAIEVMGRAFLHDPFLKHLAPDDTKRARLTPEFVGIVVKYCFLYGEVWTFPSLEGVACWLRPGKTSPSFAGMLRTGMLFMPLQFGWAGFRRFNEVVTYTESLHKQFAAGPHWYLWGLGVEPSEQRKGVGGTLLYSVLSQADAAGQPCYLETQNESNLPFYQKHGFEVVSNGVVPKSNLRVWAMLRKPKPQ